MYTTVVYEFYRGFHNISVTFFEFFLQLIFPLVNLLVMVVVEMFF